MTKEKVLTAAGAVISAVLAAALAVLLALSLKTQFAPKPTQYPDSVWVSEDGAFTLTVGKYNGDKYQCDSELSYTSSDGTVSVYTVSDGEHSVIGVYQDIKNADSWLRISCSSESFTARVNRTASLAYSEAYEKAQKLTFNRVS